jgi:PAS domain-containing protein
MNHHPKSEPKTPVWRVLFDAVPLAAFIVDEDVRILDFNPAAAALLGFAPRSSLRRRGGEVLHCVYAATAGCGKSRLCKKCIIRSSVQSALAGENPQRKFHQAELRGSRGVVSVGLLVTASLLPGTETPQVLLFLENVAETVSLSKRHLGV